MAKYYRLFDTVQQDIDCVKLRGPRHAISNKPYTYWTQKNGKKIAVKNMSSRHITNSISMLERKDKCPEWIKHLKEELNKRR